jgi:hypothetical protein
MHVRSVPLVLGLLLLSTGCGSGCERKEDETPETSGEEEQGSVGTVEGVVRMVGAADVPSYPDARLPAQPAIPEACTPPQLTDRQPVAMDGTRGLEGILVQASAFSEAAMEAVAREPTTHPLTIRDCRLTPRLVAAVRGDTLTLTNETDYPFLPTMGSGGLTQAVLFNDSRDFALDRGGIFSLTCGFAAPCGRADIVVVYHPVHTITGAGGTFRLANVPADEDVRIHAWQPLFEEASETVRVGRGETVRIELELTPAPQPEPPSDVPDDGVDEGPVENQPGLF